MDFHQRAVEIIERAEKSLGSLAAEAMTELDYAAATQIITMARRVGDIASNEPATADKGAVKQSSQATYSETVSRSANPDRSRALSSHRASRSGIEYPIFKHEGDTLVKIGWSKSDRRTYEHRSPRDVLSCLIARVQQLGRSGQRFTTDQLLPMRDSSNTELPSYQVYLCLAWLVTQGLIERHGRQGYTVRDVNGLPAAVDQAWSTLAKH